MESQRPFYRSLRIKIVGLLGDSPQNIQLVEYDSPEIMGFKSFSETTTSSTASLAFLCGHNEHVAWVDKGVKGCKLKVGGMGWRQNNCKKNYLVVIHKIILGPK